MQPHIRLFTAITGSALYPKGIFTRYEAFLDLLITAHPSGKGELAGLGDRWGWDVTQVAAFFHEIQSQGLVTVSSGAYEIRNTHLWFSDPPEPSAAEKRAITEKVIAEYNRIVGRKKAIPWTPLRAQKIWTRIKGGTRKNPITVESFTAVFEHQYLKWKDDPKMKQYLVLETLLRPENFQKYLDDAREAYVRAKSSDQKVFNPTENFE